VPPDGKSGWGSFEIKSVKEGDCIRVARFFAVRHTKMGKHIPSESKIYQMAIK
jgi:hypothetical protein